MDSSGNRNFIFVGGSGKSGTTFLTEAIGADDGVLSFPSIELKFLISRGGLLDLKHSLVQEYNVDGARQALETFELFLRRIFFQQFFNPVALDSYCDGEKLESVIGEFIASLRRDGRATIVSAEHFDNAARKLLNSTFAASKRLEESGATLTYNLEKTPHSLLHINSLNALFPQSKFVHVMRDPRAVALSLVKMDWAPNTLAECVAWLKSYCRAWARSRAVAIESGLPLLQFRLEDIASDPAASRDALSDFLALDLLPTLFDDVQKDVAASWREASPANELSYLRDALNEEMALFGYA